MMLSDETPGRLGRAVGALEGLSKRRNRRTQKKMTRVTMSQEETLSEKRGSFGGVDKDAGVQTL